MANKKDVFALDIGGSSIKSAVITIHDDKFFISDKKRAPIINSTISELKQIVDLLTNEHCYENIAISTHGPVNQHGVVINSARVEGYVNHDWKEFLKHKCENVKVHNDAQCAALGVFHADESIKTNSLVNIVVGTSMAGSAILDGKLLYGHTGYAGHYGHVQTCFEGEAYYVKDLLAEIGFKFLSKRKLGKELSVREISDQVNDPNIKEIVEIAGSFLGVAISNTIHYLNPEILTVSGGVIDAFGLNDDNIYFKSALKTAAGLGSPTIFSETEIRLTKLGNDAGLYGAASLFL